MTGSNFSQNTEHTLKIPVDNVILEGNLFIPSQATAIVIFAHGSGSGRFSPRNQRVAKALNQEKFATLLFDLLTSEEDAIDSINADYRFNIPLLADRLVGVTDWLKQQSNLKNLVLGYFGASTGAGAALIAAAKCPESIAAVVSRGGRPDLADPYLPKVKAPTLLIVGELDSQVIALNKKAQAQMSATTKLAIVPGATHLFEEPGTLDAVVQLAIDWFKIYLK